MRLKPAVLLLGFAVLSPSTTVAAQSRPEQLNREGNALARTGDHRGAIQRFSAAIAVDAEYADPWYNRGKSRINLGDYQGAIADITAAIRLEPSADAYNNRGIARKKSGDARAALADYDQALRMDPRLFRVHLNRGIAYFELGYKTAACTDFRVASSKGVPGASDALRQAGCR